MTHTATYLGFIPLLPLAGALIIGVLYVVTCKGKQISERFYGLLGCIGPVLSFFMAVKVFFALLSLFLPEVWRRRRGVGPTGA